jgi:hypothetical protein
MTIIAFEGLMGSIGQWVNRGLLSKIRDKYPKVNVWSGGWTGGAVAVSGPYVVIGHSFGVRRALAQAQATKPNAVVLIDPRWPWTISLAHVQAPKDVMTICFYQTGFMRGYPLEGAGNAKLVGYGHTAMPSHPKVFETIETMLR